MKIVMYKHTPKNINGIYGYRTKMSMINLETWKFAHDYCGRLWWKIGWILLIPSIVIQFLFINCNENIIGMVGGILCTVQVIILVASIIPVEKALKANFDSQGNKL